MLADKEDVRRVNLDAIRVIGDIIKMDTGSRI
jgi:hypothetical protein